MKRDARSPLISWNDLAQFLPMNHLAVSGMIRCLIGLAASWAILGLGSCVDAPEVNGGGICPYCCEAAGQASWTTCYAPQTPICPPLPEGTTSSRCAGTCVPEGCICTSADNCAPARCDPLLCPTGCCDENETCQSGTSVTACGIGGRHCAMCGAGQSCGGPGQECLPLPRILDAGLGD